MPLTIHNYHPDTKEYLGPAFADPSPLEPGEYLIPAFATTEAPPSAPAGKAAVRRGKAWVLVNDKRGVYWMPDGSRHVVADLEIDPPDGALNKEPVRAEPTIAQLRIAATFEIDGRAEAARLAFITNGAGQALVYEAKRRESADCLTNHSAAAPPATGLYPMLDAEVGITVTAGGADTKDAYQVAVVVDAMVTAWLAAAVAIETVRLGAKRGIAAAPDLAAIDTILAGLAWPQP